jgi:hypothetical protein
MDVQTAISIVLGVIAVSTAAGLGLLRGTVVGLREQLDDERKLSTSLRAQRTEDRALIVRLQGDLEALGRVVTGEAHWIAIGQELTEHHDAAVSHWEVERGLLREIRDNTQENK